MNIPKTSAAEVEAEDPSVSYAKTLQGPVVKLTVGYATAAVSYTLPQAILSKYSQFFKIELQNVNVQQSSTEGASQVRQKTPAALTTGIGPLGLRRSSTSVNIEVPELRFVNIDPIVFGKFLMYIFAGQFDSTYYAKVFELTPSNVQMHVSIAAARAIIEAGAPDATATFGALQLPVPIVIQAWVLGEKVLATQFMNYCMGHIYQGCGSLPGFSITPVLVEWVWRNTNANGALRKFCLDVLAQYWGQQPNRHVAKYQDGLKRGWQILVDQHQDLRECLCFGLNERRVAQLGAYYVRVPPMPVRSMSRLAPSPSSQGRPDNARPAQAAAQIDRIPNSDAQTKTANDIKQEPTPKTANDVKPEPTPEGIRQAAAHALAIRQRNRALFAQTSPSPDGPRKRVKAATRS